MGRKSLGRRSTIDTFRDSPTGKMLDRWANNKEGGKLGIKIRQRLTAKIEYKATF